MGKSMAPRVIEYYKRRVGIALDFPPRRRGRAAHSAECVDQLPTHLMNSRRRDGEHNSCGVELPAAWVAIIPEYGKCGTLRLPRSGRAQKGWRRLVPGRAREPYPFLSVAGLVAALIQLGELEVGLWVLVAFGSTGCRAGA
ncbi:unnamed protein product [Prorocentrum cordatum]|uniref:Uncharacterized protein n=1 Tax=Prorocentrum cordatum TaxID=2364126 RepID=A0ABN9PF96_9DINO|nr:unnamed protein product [Polarella glacialis]